MKTPPDVIPLTAIFQSTSEGVFSANSASFAFSLFPSSLTFGMSHEVAPSSRMNVAIAIGFLERTIVVPDIGNGSLSGCKGKCSTGFGCHATHMNTRMPEMCRNHSTHMVPCAECMLGGLALGFRTWKAVRIHQTDLPASVTRGCDAQRDNQAHLELFWDRHLLPRAASQGP
jgi:hypothetical protein